jgi:branched-chain amino acid transport system substrate-binding protein
MALASAARAAPIRVGFLAPLTGPASELGVSARLGAELAVAEINEVGGYLGRPIELVVRDDRGDPKVGRQEALDLLQNEKVAFTIGAGSTGVTMGMLDIFQQQRHLLMVGMATGSQITARHAPASSYIFRMAASDTLQASFMVDEVARSGFTRVAVFADTTPYGEGGLADLQRFLSERQIALVHVARFKVGTPSLLDEVKQAKVAGAQAVLAYTVAPEQALIAKARAETGFAGPQYAPWTGSSRLVWERAGSAANGLVVVQTIIHDLSNEHRSSFIARLKRYAKGHNVASLMAAGQHYDALHLMVRALFQTRGDTSGDALKKALENLDYVYRGVVTTHAHPFSPQDHEAFSKNMTWAGVWRNGEIQFLHPEDARRASYIRKKSDH